jgi:hypothetical protein
MKVGYSPAVEFADWAEQTRPRFPQWDDARSGLSPGYAAGVTVAAERQYISRRKSKRDRFAASVDPTEAG